MHPFSTCLNALIKARNVKITALSQYLNIDRSSFHQVLNGKRLPSSPDIVDSIAAYLSLCPEEHAALKQAWTIEKVTPPVYYRRKHVRSFLESYLPEASFTNLPLWNMMQDFSGLPDGRFPESHRLLNGRREVLLYLGRILREETAHPQGRIALRFQPDQKPFMDLLRVFPAVYPFRMDHIICLNQTDEIDTNRKMINLSLLSEILPLYQKQDITYRTFYHYDDSHSHFSMFNGMPCLFLTSSCAISARADFQNALLYTDKDCVRIFWDLFRKCRQISPQLIHAYPVCEINRPLLEPMEEIYIPVSPVNPLHRNLLICISEQKMALIYNRIIHLIQEVSILSAFRDFLTCEEANDIYTSKNGKEFLNGLWRELCPPSPNS